MIKVKEAKKFIETLPINIINKIKLVRIGWDQLGNKGIINVIRVYYPLYIAKS